MFGFGPRKPVPGPPAQVYGVAVTATAAEAVTAARGADRVRPVRLGVDRDELDLVVRLDCKPVEVGAAGVARKWPHLVCAGFLPHLGRPLTWQAGRGVTTPESAVGAVFAAVAGRLAGAEAVGLALPAYLSPAQVKAVLQAAAGAGLPVRASAATALAIAADQDDPAGAGVVVDIDDFALTAGVVGRDGDGVRLLAGATLPAAALKLWKDRLLDAVCDRCVRLCRRDPRDMPAAEQDLFDQLDPALDRLADGLGGVTLTVRSAHWLQELPHLAADFDGYCANLARVGAAGVGELVRGARLAVPPGAVWVTRRAARLPGFLAAVAKAVPDRTRVTGLPAFAAAGAAAALAGRPAGPHAADGLSCDPGPAGFRVPARQRVGP